MAHTSERSGTTPRRRGAWRDVHGLLLVLGIVVVGLWPLYWADLMDLLRPLPRDRAGATALQVLAARRDSVTVTVYKSPGCLCCARWVEHMRRAGFRVRTDEQSDVAAVRRSHGVADSLASCHTAVVGRYVVEGHVPPADVARLITEQPSIRGLALPGMPRGAPGMEDMVRTRYDVRAVGVDGRSRTYARH